MAFGGIFNPNYTMLPQQQGQVPQLPQQNANLTQQGYGNSDPMALYSLYGLLGAGNSKSATSVATKPPPTQTPGQTTPPVSTYRPGSDVATTPYTQYEPFPTTPPVTGTPIPKPGGGGTPPPTDGTPIPKPGLNTPPPPAIPPEIPNVNSAEQAGQAWMSQYNSPEYAAWYNSLPPSTRAFAHAPGNANTGQYLYNAGYDNYNAFGNNPPWVPNR